MRLIDADKLELKHYVQRVTDKPIGYGGTQPIYANYDIIAYDVDNAPTVNAIPIEWIVKRINYYSDLILKHPNEKELLYSQTELISLLEDWERENEEGKDSLS